MKGCYAILALFLSACSTVPMGGAVSDANDNEVRSMSARANKMDLHDYAEQLARQLFDTSGYIDSSNGIVIGTILPADTLSPSDNLKLSHIGLQLQESFTTLATQAGLKVIEYKTLNNVELISNADLMLSRDVNKILDNVNAQYVLTGTYIPMENDIIVNVRLIESYSKTIVAAATATVPLGTLWDHNKVKIQNHGLYRGEY
jgi:TolB-like protein